MKAMPQDVLVGADGSCQIPLMRPGTLNQLLAIARREGVAHLAEDIVQEALVIAVEAGRLDMADAETVCWLRGVVRNRARMNLRSERRRTARERAYLHTVPKTEPETGTVLPDVMKGLPPSLRGLAALVLTGHNRREVAYLLNLSDTALRQRISALKRALRSRGLVPPSELTGLTLNLNYGRIRDALLPELQRQRGSFASHDPDGHLFVVKSSQNTDPRQ